MHLSLHAQRCQPCSRFLSSLCTFILSCPYQMSALSAGQCPRTVKQSTLCGLRTACLHVTAACEEKWECKWKPGMYGQKYGINWRKDYLNYIKRKKRAEAKRDLLKWHSMDISAIDFVEVCETGRAHSFSKENKQQNDGRTYSYRWSSKTGRSSPHKQHQRSFDKEEGRCYKGFSSGPFHFFWHCDTSHQNQSWGYTWESLFHENSSWEESSSFRSDQAKNEKLKTEKTVGSSIDRQTLGLSPSGPLTVEELKKAFRLSALKWHPDRHHGPTKVIAEAKFKHCGAAYKSLLDAVASV